MSYHAIIPAAGVGRRMGENDPRPKSLLSVAGRPILLRALDALATRNTTRVTLIVGHGRAAVMDTVGAIHRGMAVDYVENADFATTEHGWSVFLARDAWLDGQQPVLFMDADNVFDPRLLDVLIAHNTANTVLVDPSLDTSQRDEELVLGANGQVTGFVRGRVAGHPQYVGGFVGMNRFDAAFMRTLFTFMQDFFAHNGRGFKYERVFDALLGSSNIRLDYLETGNLAWVNVNHVEELALARRIVGMGHQFHPAR